MNEIWETRDGSKIKVKDMTTQHILNCIRCIEDGRINFIINMGWASDNDYQEFDEDTEKKERWIKIFNKELEKRKEYICKEDIVLKGKSIRFVNI